MSIVSGCGTVGTGDLMFGFCSPCKVLSYVDLV